MGQVIRWDVAIDNFGHFNFLPRPRHLHHLMTWICLDGLSTCYAIYQYSRAGSAGIDAKVIPITVAQRVLSKHRCQNDTYHRNGRAGSASIDAKVIPITVAQRVLSKHRCRNDTYHRNGRAGSVSIDAKVIPITAAAGWLSEHRYFPHSQSCHMIHMLSSHLFSITK